MTMLLLALLIGVIAGLRALTAPAIVSWAAALGWLNLDGSWLAFLGYRFTPYVFTVLALVEFVTDQLPSTPSRKVPMQFGARLLSGALCGAAIGIAIRAARRRARGRHRRRRDRHARRRRGARTPRGLLRQGPAGRPHRGCRRHPRRRARPRGAVMGRRFDAIIIGAGQAGPPLAGRLTAAGHAGRA